MNNINNKLQCFKSAVAFLFLFFLHGFSIENGQQGITPNDGNMVSGFFAINYITCCMSGATLKHEL